MSSSSSALPSSDILARRARRAELQASRTQALTAAHAVLTDEDRRRALVKAFCELNGGYASNGGGSGEGASGVRNSVVLPASGTPYTVDGVDVANRALQTSDGEFESFEDVTRICAEFRKELRIVFRMLESNQTRAIRLSTDSLYTTTRARLAALESLHHAQLISARRTCRQQFRTAVRELLRSQREYNSSSVRELEAALEPELRASEAAVRKSEKELRYAVDEEERLAFQNARVGLVMLKKGLFSANEAPAIEALAAKAIDTVVLYQSSLSKLDDEIFNLRGRISELSEHFDEAAEELDVLNNPTVRSRPITQGGASSSTRRGSVMSARTGRGGTAGGGGAGSAWDSTVTSTRASSASVAAGTERHTRESTAPGNRDGAGGGGGGGVGGGRSGSGAPRGGDSEDEAEAAHQQRPLSPYSFLSEEEREKLDAHRAHYEAMVRELHETQAQEHRNATTARLSHLAQWTRQILSLSALGEPPTLRKITARQLALLQLALKHSKPRPCVDTGTTAYSSGLTLVMLAEEQRRESIRLAEEEQKRIERMEESKRKAEEKRQRELEEDQQRIAAAKAAALALEAVQQSTSTLQQVASTPRLTTTAPASRRKRRPSADGGGNARARYHRIARGLALRGAGDEPEKLRDPSFGKKEAVLGVHLDAGAEAAEYPTAKSGSASTSRRQQPSTDAGTADTADAAPPVPPPSPVPKPERLEPPPTPPSSPPLQPQRHKPRAAPQVTAAVPQTRYVTSIPGPARRAVLLPASATAVTKTSLPPAPSPQPSLQPIPSVTPLQPTPQVPSDMPTLAITATSSALPRRIALSHHPHHYNLASYHRPAAAPPPPPAPLQPRADVVVSYVEAASARARTIKARIPVPVLTDEEGLMIESMTIRPWSAISDGGRGW
ncbi:hypothetical protein HDU90_002251 [Geranomyces variabilis]|nr:hypothetical protein HDU90_002251 [Geranomyces variabilis]